MANRYWVSGGNGLWSSTTNWSASSGGASGASVPGTSDIAYLNATSGAGTVVIDGAATPQQLICTGFTGTLDSNNASNTITISSNITIPATMSYGATPFTMRAGTVSGTINMAIKFPWDFWFIGSVTKTISQSTGCLGSTYFTVSPTINSGTGGPFEWETNGILTGNPGSASTYSFNGNIYCRLKGGVWDRIIKNTGSLILDGNVTIKGNTTNTAVGVGGLIFQYVSGTITVENDCIWSITGTNTFTNIGTNVIFDKVNCSGTTTINTDLYIANGLQDAGTSTMTFVGPYVVHIGYGGGVSDLVMYNLGTFISSDTKLSIEGTGTIFKRTSFNGMTYETLNPLQIGIDINTDGTVTIDPISTKNQFGGGRTLKYIKGTVVATNCQFSVASGGFNFDTNDSFTIPTMIIDGQTANFITDATITNLNIYNAGICQMPNTKEITVSTSLNVNGTNLLKPSLYANPITVTEFVSDRSVSFDNSPYDSSLYWRSATFPLTGSMTDYTIAFDFIHVGYYGRTIMGGTGGGEGYFWIPSSAPNSIYFFSTPTTGYYFFTGLSADITTRHRIVMTKTLGQSLKAYVNGSARTTFASGGGDLNGAINFNYASYQMQGDVLLYNGTVKDQAWVTSDYNAFIANGRSSNGLYDNTEAGLTVGMHTDQWTDAVTQAKIKYLGTKANAIISNADIRYMNASESTIPLLNWFGPTSDSTNIKRVTSDNIKTQSYAFA